MFFFSLKGGEKKGIWSPVASLVEKGVPVIRLSKGQLTETTRAPANNVKYARHYFCYCSSKKQTTPPKQKQLKEMLVMSDIKKQPRPNIKKPNEHFSPPWISVKCSKISFLLFVYKYTVFMFICWNIK